MDDRGMCWRLGPERKRLGGMTARRAYPKKKPADQSDKKRRDEGGRFRCDPHGVFPLFNDLGSGLAGALIETEMAGQRGAV
jgi:hypothetical protein